MDMGACILSAPVPDAEGVDIVPPLVNDPVPIGIVSKESGTRYKGTYSGVDALAP